MFSGHRGRGETENNAIPVIQSEIFHRLLVPLVKDFQALFRGVFMNVGTAAKPQTQVVHAILGKIQCDEPATRGLLSMASHASHNHFCSKCKMTRDTRSAESMRCFCQFQLGEPKTREENITLGSEWLRQTNKEQRRVFVQEHGVRFSPFNKLSYFDIIQDHTYDSFHTFLEGSCSACVPTLL